MIAVRVRTKLLISLFIVSFGLSCASLLIVKRTTQKQIVQSLNSDLRHSVAVFENSQRQRQTALVRSSRLLADLPSLRALMTTEDALTIQDGSEGLWKLSGEALFVLTDSAGHVLAIHGSDPRLQPAELQPLLEAMTEQSEIHRLYANGHLYEVSVQPIFFGRREESHQLGLLAAGYEIDTGVAKEISQVAAAEVAFSVGDQVVATTLSKDQERELILRLKRVSSAGQNDEVHLGDERFLAASVALSSSPTDSVRLTVLKSYDQASRVLTELNRLLFALGLLALAVGSAIAFYVSRTVTEPLESLVQGVSALERGDYGYPLLARGADEVAELTSAFNRMRQNLKRVQQDLLDAEKMAVIGRMASSISHDLRHQLSAIFANAEFLSMDALEPKQREDLLMEVRLAVNEMTDLIDSLLEFSRTRESLHPSYGSLDKSIEHVISRVKTAPEFSSIPIEFRPETPIAGWFDLKRLERAIHNLILNACQAVARLGESGRVGVRTRSTAQHIVITIEDNGPGIPQEILKSLFQPFVSAAKENGTGLGLTIAQKTVTEHGGSLVLSQSQPGKTVFIVSLPILGVQMNAGRSETAVLKNK